VLGKLRQNAARRDHLIALRDRALNVVPVDVPQIEPYAEPTARTDVRGQVEAPRVAGGPVDVLSKRRLAADGHDAVSVMVLEKIGEDPAPYAEVGVITTDRALGFRKGQTDLAQFAQAAVFL